MASTSISQSSSSGEVKRHSVQRVFIYIALFLLLASAAVFGWFYSAATRALPQLDGTLVLHGLKSPVTVVRDAHGVPNITASSLEDLFFAQGFVTAQDRLWNMDIYRRFAAGELSAALGASYVDRDTYQRTLGLRQVAERAAAALSPRDRAYFEAYARGVNAYIQEHQYSLPLEFRVLRYFPRAWTIEDSFLVGAALSEGLNHGYFRAELTREKFIAKIGPDLTDDLYVNSSFRDIPPGTDGQELRNDEPEGADESPAERTEQPRPKRRRHSRPIAALDWPLREADALITAIEQPALRPGSNSWVLSGQHTASGKPLLANDMHLDHQMPNVWYEAHLTSGDYDVAGVTLPGLPYVIVGHNRRIAWGITNLGADVEDTYVETFNSQGQYQTPAGWRDPERRKETIRVIRGRDVPIEVVVTRHGPIINKLLKNEPRMIALKSVTWDSLHPMTYPFFDINTASNWQQFTDALSKFTSPSENFMYADVDGHIGYHANGLIPIRANGNGDLPSDGSNDTHEWTGYIPFDKLPSSFDPPSGILATANSRVTPDGYPYVLATEWIAPYRTERIYRVLRQDKKFTPADMLALQTDVYSSFDRFIAQRLVYSIDHAANPSKKARNAAEILRTWDGRMAKDSAAAAIVRIAGSKLQRILLESKLGDDAKLYRWFMSEVWLENVVLLQPQRWLPSQYPNYNELLTAAVEQTVTDSRAPRNLESWNYGNQFPIEIRHDLFGHFPILNHWAGPGVQPQSGDRNTVKQVGRSFGPSERLTVDFSNFDNSTLNIVNGQSGNLFSPYLNDQWDAWYHGTTFPLPFSEGAVANSTRHKLTLVPGD